MLLVLSLCVAPLSLSAELCGYISQESEGTLLEVPVDLNNPLTSYNVYRLEGADLDTIDQGGRVCVTFTPGSHPSQKIIHVESFKAWIRNTNASALGI